MKFFEDDLICVYHDRCENIVSSIPDESIDGIFTDPPYGISYASNKPRRKGQYKQIEGDGEVSVAILTDLYRVLKPNGAAYLFTRWDVMEQWRVALQGAGFIVKNELMWDKGGFGMGDLEGDWATTHETILYCTKGDHKLNPPRRSSVLSVQKVNPSKMVHPNEKPVGVWYPMIFASTKAGDIVLDPYAGSCSSILAARQTGRRAIGVEYDIENLSRIMPRLGQAELLRTS